MKTSLKILFTFVALLFNLAGISHAQNPQQIAKKALESTVLLVMEDANGQPLSLGSGFFVRTNQVATNLHVIQGASRGYVKPVGKKTKYNILGVTAVDTIRDLAILKVSSVLGAKAIPLGDSDTVQVGSPVYAVGNPRGLEGTFSQGIISGIRKIGTDKILQITAPISPGSSGGPVLNGKGQVIGVSVATYRSGQNLNFAIPSNYLEKLIKQIGIAKPFPKQKPTGSKSSVFGALGGKSTQGITAGKLSWEFIDNPFIYNKHLNFSLRNHTSQNVKSVYFYVIFYDNLGDPIDVEIGTYPLTIPAGLAKRTFVEVDSDVAAMVKKVGGIQPVKNRVKFRILDFEIVE